MPATPARAAREEAAVAAERARTAAINEAKFTEFRLNCDAGVVGACNGLGEWFELMRGDAASAAALYAPACLDHGYAQACWNLGKILGECRDSPRATRCWLCIEHINISCAC